MTVLACCPIVSLVNLPRAAILAAGRSAVAATSLLHTSQDTHILRTEMKMENCVGNFRCPLVERADNAHLLVAVSSPRVTLGVVLASLEVAMLGGVGVGNVRAVIIGMGSDVSVKIADEVKPPFIKRVDMVKGKDMFK